MAATVGELVVNLKARTGAFSKGMQTSGRQVTTFGSKVAAAGQRLAAFGSTMIGVAGVAGIVAMVKKNMDLMDSTAKLADRIGITTEALQGLRHAAELTGAGADTLDAGLTTMAKRLGEAARGAGAAVPALKLLGLSIDDLIQKSPDQQFIAIGEAISKLSTHTERAAAAANIFSKGNMALINTLAEGREGIERMQADAARLGKTFSRETAKSAEDANDAIARLVTTLNGQSLKKSGGLMSSIEGFANTLRGMIDLFNRMDKHPVWKVIVNPGGKLLEDRAKIEEWFLGPTFDFGERGMRDTLARGRRGAGGGGGMPSLPEAGGGMGAGVFDRTSAISDRIDNLIQRIAQARLDKIGRIRDAISGAMGGDGASLQLSGAAAFGSAAAYSAIVRRGLQGTAKRTDEQILQIAKQQLEEERKTNQKIDELIKKFEAEGEVEIR